MFSEVNGVRLFTRRVGSGPVVIVLHGGPGAHHDYLLPQYDLLAAGNDRALFYYDQRGGGQSAVTRETPVGWHEHVADLDGLRGLLGLDRLTLCGYSWGGLLALLYLKEHPGCVERLALVSPAAPTRGLREQFDAEFARRTASPEIRKLRQELSPFELAVAPYFRDPADARRLTPFRVTGRTQKEVWDSLGDYDMLAQLRQMSSLLPLLPSLVLHGTFDPIPIAGSRALAEVLGARMVELPTGHCPHVEATEQFTTALDEFLPKR
jgi:proline iminopeptidase